MNQSKMPIEKEKELNFGAQNWLIWVINILLEIAIKWVYIDGLIKVVLLYYSCTIIHVYGDMN
jgi:hypothetical protein